jgi:hypothetical protein
MSERADNALKAAEISGLPMRHILDRAGLPPSTPFRWKEGRDPQEAKITAFEDALRDLATGQIASLQTALGLLPAARTEAA